MSMRACIWAAILAVVGFGLSSQAAFAQDGVTPMPVNTRTTTVRAIVQESSSLFVQYGIAGKPTNLAIENSARVWVTLPELNAIGVISVTATTSPTVTAYQVRTYYLTPGSQPYDLAFAGGALWFTAFGGNAIGRIDPTTDAMQMYPIPVQDSGPTGIAVATDGTIWFAQQKANNLGQFNPISGTFATYPYSFQNAGLEEVATVTANSIWMTAPAVNRIVNFEPSTNGFASIPTLPYTQPVGLALEPGDVPWVSTMGSNLIGRYSPGTLALWRWTALPSADATALGPQRIALTKGSAPWNLFYANAPAQIIGQIYIGADTAPGRIRQLPGPGSACTPLDVAVDNQNNAWFTCGNANTVVNWRSPYTMDRYLPLMVK